MGAVGAAVAGAAVSTIGGAVLGGGKKGSGGSQEQTSSSSPWSPQQPYITGALGDAQNIYNQRQAQGPYGGNFYAGLSQGQTDAANQALQWTGGTGGTLAGQTAGTAGTLQGAASPFVQNAAGLASRGIQGPDAGLYGALQGYGTGQQTTQGANPALSHALNQSAIQGAQSLGQFQNTLQAATQQGLSNPTERIAADAATYANNPGVQASLNSVNNQIDQTLHEQTLPGLNRQASMGGVLNSSRAGMGEAMANESAALAKGNASAQILNNAYNQGLSTAAGTYTSGLNSAINGSTLGYNDLSNNANANATRETGLNEFNTNAQLTAANQGLSQGLNYQLGNANTQLGANQQLGSAAGLGVNAASASQEQALANYGLGSQAGGLFQQGNQANLNNQYAQWQMNNTYGQNVLNDYWNIASRNLGGNNTATSSTTLPPNTMGNLVGGGLAGAGLYKQFAGGSGSDGNFLGLGSGNANSTGLFGGQGPVFNTAYGQYNGGQSLYGAYDGTA